MARKKRNLSTNFALTCILPASLLLIAVCCLSLMFTSKSLVHSIKRSMEGQGSSKVGNVTEIINGAVGNSAFPKRASEIGIALSDNSNDEIFDILTTIKLRSSAYADIELYDFSSGKRYTTEGCSDISEEPFWYDNERFTSGKPYYKTRDISQDKEGKLSLLTYIYQFSSDGSDVPDICFAVSIDNRSVTKPLELSVSVKESKWMIFSSDYRIIYHSMGYNPDIFQTVEGLMTDYDPSRLIQSFMGRQVVLYVNEMSEFDGMVLFYVVPVDGIVKDSTGSIILVIILTVISIAILAFFIRLMTKKMVKEINAIRESLKGIHEKKYIGSIKSETQDELGDLVEDFNKVIEFLTYQAEHDENTGFYNARAFAAKAHKLLNSDYRKKNYAVIRVDIDNFSFINDIFDWDVGNHILLKIANIIHAVFDDGAIHGYLGNDIFVVLFGYDDKDEMFTRILKASDDIKACEDRIHLVPHFGVSDDVQSDADISVVCDCAGVALKTIKGSLLKVYAVYDDSFKEAHSTQKFVESKKQEALDNRDFFIQLQPKYDVVRQKVVGAEALVRWKINGKNEIMPPGKFIPIFEQNGFIIPLDKYVWEETCKVMKSWRDRGFEEIPVSVNVSRMHINNPEFARELSALVKKYGIRPELLEIEITESALIKKGEEGLALVMRDLKDRGFRLLMDDFAQGYSSLLSLQKMPFDVIKIDKALIDHVDEKENQKFVAGTVSFLLELDKKIVVEGVETDEQIEILKEAGCEVIQGYCFSRPLNVEDFEKLAFGEKTE